MSQGAARYPRVAEYLAGLPDADEGSHAQCRVSVALARGLLEALPFASPPEPGELPESVLQLVRELPPAGAWVDERATVALFLAAADHHRLTDAEFLRTARELNRRLLTGRKLKVLMSLATPELLVSGAPLRWNAVHQGTVLVAREAGRNAIEAELTFPSGLYQPLMLRCFGTAFEAALELANAKAVSVELASFDDRHASFVVGWS